MGKATILEHLGYGQYNIQVDIDHSRIIAFIVSLIEKISKLETAIAGMKPDYGKETNIEAKEKIYKLYLLEKETAKLKLHALKKEKSRLESIQNEPIIREVWCADYSLGLSGQVGTIEVPGDMAFVNVKPGHAAQASYVNGDGIIGDAYTNGPSGTLYNLAMMPGWQKWKPTYRYATITKMYEDKNKCDISLLDIPSSQQELNINKFTDYKNVSINYMGKTSSDTCFFSGDNVLVSFQNQDWNFPTVVGFKDHPRPIYKPTDSLPEFVTFDFSITTQSNFEDFGLGRHYTYSNTGWIFDYEDRHNIGYCYTLPTSWNDLSIFWKLQFHTQRELDEYIEQYNGKKLEPLIDSRGDELYADISYQSISGHSCVGLAWGPMGWGGIIFYPDVGGRETDRTGQVLNEQLSEMYAFSEGVPSAEVWVYDHVAISNIRFG